MYFIRERRVEADPREAVHFEALAMPEARPPLGPDPAQWLGPAAADWSGTTEQIRWEPGAPRPVLFEVIGEPIRRPVIVSGGWFV